MYIYVLLIVAFGKEFRLWDEERLKVAFICLFITSFCIYLRNVYRVADYASPVTSDIDIHEYYFIAFEGSVIFFAMVTYAVLHFGRILPASEENYLTSPVDKIPSKKEENVEEGYEREEQKEEY